MNARAHAFRALRQRLEIDVGGQVGVAWRAQRIGKGVTGDRLQRVAQSEMGVTVVDDQSGSVRTHTPAELERNTVGAPFVDRAFGGMTQGARHRRFEERQRIGCRTDEKIAVRRDIDDTLMPAAGLFDRLVNWQRIDEFVGDDDARAAGDILEFIVPQDRHVEIVKLALLHLLQRGT